MCSRYANDYSTNRERRKEAFFAASIGDRGGAIASSIIVALTLLLVGSSFVLLSPTPMIASTAFAQEEENNTTGGATTTATDDTATATTGTPSGLELSAQPVWDEQVTSTGVTPINETHSVGTFIGNGTMTVPATGETVNMTNNGTAIISPVPGYADTVSASGREYVFSEDDDDDISAITFHEIIRYNPETFEGNGLVIAVFDNNATGSLAPFNGMMVVGTHEEDPTTRTATIRLWEWESGIPIPPVTTTDMEESPASPTMNTTTTTDTTAADTNATTATEEEGGEEEAIGLSEGQISPEEQQQAAEEEEEAIGEQQQQTTPTIPPNPLFE